MTSLSSALRSALSSAKVTRSVIVEPQGLAQLAAVFAREFPDRTAIVVADANTWSAAGERAQQLLAAAGITTAAPHVFATKGKLKADARYARELADSLKDRDCIVVAAGSGVLNDLGKYASGLLNRPYLCVPTAASMDGYSASGASLLDAGFKRTLPCPPPTAIVADLDVIRAAPAKMAGWGYGDLAGKLVAALDWHVADALGEDRINALPFALVQDNLAQWLSNPGGVASGDAGAIGDLISGLLISGFAIQAHGDSRPASGSEHQFAHLWEMEGLQVDGAPASHGACVGLATVTMLKVYEALLAADVVAAARAALPLAQPSEAELRADIDRLFPLPEVRDAAWQEARAKLIAPEALRARRERIAAVWPDLARVLHSKFVSPAVMAAGLRAAGAPTRPEQMNMTPASLERDFHRAQFVRRRYTVLDLLRDTGLYDRVAKEALGPRALAAEA
jgi:glycerol-1-phosphate dehydrogenase [NAD(P)+]